MVYALSQLLKACGMTLAIVVSIVVAPLGILWDVLANPEARRSPQSRRGGFPLSLKFDANTWYGRLYRRAYGEDREWIVFLRRWLFATGFSYGGKVPTHAEYKHVEAFSADKARDIAYDAFRARHEDAYQRALAFLRSPPIEQPFYPNGQAVSRCPVFYKVAIACVCYVLGVALRRQVTTLLALLIMSTARGVAAIAVGGVRGAVALFTITRVRYGRAFAYSVVAGAFMIAVLGVSATGLNTWRWYTYEWHPAHLAKIEAERARIAYDLALAESEVVALPEKDAHAVQRAIEANAFEARVVLAATDAIITDIATRVAQMHAQCDRVLRGYRRGQKTPAVQWVVSQDLSYFVANNLEMDTVEAVRNAAWAVIYDERSYSWSWRIWWEDVFESNTLGVETSSAYPTAVERAPLIARVVSDVAHLVAEDIARAQEEVERYRSIAQEIVREHDQVFLALALQQVLDLQRVHGPRAVYEWVSERCAFNGEADAWFARSWASELCVGEGLDQYCAFPSDACMVVTDLFRHEYLTGMANNTAALEEAVKRKHEAFAERERQENARNAAYRTRFLAALAAKRSDPVALVADLRSACRQERQSGQWYGHYTSDDDTCRAAVEEFSEELALVESDERALATMAAAQDFWHRHGAKWTWFVLIAISAICGAMAFFRRFGAFLGALLLPLVLATYDVVRFLFVVMVVCPAEALYALVLAVCCAIRDAVLFILAFGRDVKNGACELVDWH